MVFVHKIEIMTVAMAMAMAMRYSTLFNPKVPTDTYPGYSTRYGMARTEFNPRVFQLEEVRELSN